MGLMAKEEKNVQLLENGVYHAVCYALYDLGTHVDEKYKKAQRKVMLTWEVPDERITIEGESRPYAVSRELTLSLGEKAHMRKLLESWRGRPFTEQELHGFDLTKLLGTNCMLQVMRSDNGKYLNVTNAMPLYKGLVKKEPENKTFFYSIEEDGYPSDAIPKWIREKILKSEEMKGQRRAEEDEPPPNLGQGGIPADEDDDVPF